MTKEYSISRRGFLNLGLGAAALLVTACMPSIPTVETKVTKRTSQKQMLADLGLTPEQVASHPDEVNGNTKAYLGPLLNYDDKGEIIPVFNRIGHLDHIYTDYPEGWIPTIDLTIGAVPKEELLQRLQRSEFDVSIYAEEMIRSEDFTTKAEPLQVRLIKPHVGDFGFTTVATNSEIYARGEKLGADLCLPEVGPRLRLMHRPQLMSDTYYIAMKQITVSNGYPHVFRLGSRRGGSRYYLGSDWTGPDAWWGPGTQIVFSLSSKYA